MDRDEAFDILIGVAAGTMLHIGEQTHYGQQIRKALETIIGKTELDFILLLGEELFRSEL